MPRAEPRRPYNKSRSAHRLSETSVFEKPQSTVPELLLSPAKQHMLCINRVYPYERRNQKSTTTDQTSMNPKQPKTNPHCPVPGCKVKHPHRKAKDVDALMRLTELPHVMCQYVIEGLAHLGNSACNDLANRNAFGFLTRQRQIQELYIKTLYLLLMAEEAEQAHMVSGRCRTAWLLTIEGLTISSSISRTIGKPSRPV